MKIYITYSQTDPDRIISVQSLDYWKQRGKTEEEIDAAIDKNNQQGDRPHYDKLEVKGQEALVMRFLLGDGQYQTHRNITNVYNAIRELNDTLESMRQDCFEACESVEEQMKKLAELVPEEDRD